ncbi:uncharacterized protein [Scyliorhinus torazame]|uniref:uncharacterized protein isoform X2 n=1 Tax=Scyliorhinus torazame TaxID=75743 RepID=UPI003B5C5594
MVEPYSSPAWWKEGPHGNSPPAGLVGPDRGPGYRGQRPRVGSSRVPPGLHPHTYLPGPAVREQRNNHLQEQNVHLQELVKNMKANAKAQDNQLQEVQEKLNESQSIQESIQEQNVHLQERLENMEANAKTKANLLQEVQKKHRESLSKQESLQWKIAGLQKDNTNLEDDLQKKQREVDQLADRNSWLNSQQYDCGHKPCPKQEDYTWFIILICIFCFCLGLCICYTCS